MTYTRWHHIIVVAIALLLVTGIMSGCSQNQPATDKLNAPINTVQDPTLTSASTPDLNSTKEAGNQTVRQQRSALATSAAEHPLPTSTPWLTPILPYPTETPLMGLQGCIDQRSSSPMIYTNCWIGMVNGIAITVGVGVENDHNGPLDTSRSVIIVYTGTEYINNPNMTIYQAPPSIGALSISSVNNTRFTLIPIDLYHQMAPIPGGTPIVFDLATRQFLDPSGTPIPTTPVPTP